MRWLLLLSVISLRVDESHQHYHNILEEILAPSDRHADYNIVSENDILLEEIMDSAKDVVGLFDADIPGKLGLGVRRRSKRQIDQEDIKNALCKDKIPGRTR